MKLRIIKKGLFNFPGIAILIFYTSLNTFAQQVWTRVPSPDTSVSRNILTGISGTSSSDVWAVGHFESTTPGNLKNLIMHWDGTGWQIFNGTDQSSTYNALWDIAAISASNVWAVGTYNDPGTSRSELMHWNGTAWTHTSLPSIPGGSFLFGIDAISANDIWAVGGQEGSPTRPGYTIHYNGSAWTEFSAASPGTFRNYFSAVDGVSSNDVWAVGMLSNSYGDYHAMAQHWNGSNWTNIPLPSSISAPLGELTSVTAIASNDVWAVGSTVTGILLLIHWDGTEWSEVTTTGCAGGVIVAGGTDIFSVGYRISQWNGNGWTIIDSLDQLSFPSLVSVVSFSNGDIWTAGRTFDNDFHTLVYRTANAQPQFLHGNTQLLNIIDNSTPQNIDEMLKVEDADICQVVIYTLETLPSHGTVSGLPDTAITNNGFTNPSGVTYVRTSGYTGSDQFVVKASVGSLVSQTIFNVEPSTILPVLLSSYAVNKMGSTAIIQWSTAIEINTKEFIVERSEDGFNFVAAYHIRAKGMAYKYGYIDPLPLPGWNYYRLQLHDIDGQVTIFPVKGLKFEIPELKPFTVFPNPVVDRVLKIQINTPDNYILSLFNLKGQQLMKKKLAVTGSLLTVDLPGHLESGMYLISLTNGNVVWSKKVFIK